MTVTAYIGLGSNLNEPIVQIEQALSEINRAEGIRLVRTSSLYRSSPLGPQDQPAYINAVAEVCTHLSALELLRCLQGLEQAHGRQRTAIRWSARPLDLDILLYGEKIIRTKNLTIPHAGLFERAFVLYPLLEIAPVNFTIPGDGLLTTHVADCAKGDLEIIKNAALLSKQ